MKRSYIICAAAAIAVMVSCSVDYTESVDPKIGSAANGHVFVGASVPFGFVQLGPTNNNTGWDWCSGYRDDDPSILGFSHTHLSGTGATDLMDITVLPVTGSQAPVASLRKESERVVPGYYRSIIDESGILAELTATSRAGFHRYTFPPSDSAAIYFNFDRGSGQDPMTEAGFEAVGDKAVKGYRFSRGWAANHKIFFYAEFSQSFDNSEFDGHYGKLCFNKEKGGQLLMKVGISAVSEEGAKANLKAEIPGWNFDGIVKSAKASWNKELSRIDIVAPNDSTRKIFYTAMYHFLIHPAEYDDVDGQYRGSDDAIHKAEDFHNYTIFSLWDTYRAALPLGTIILPDKMDDFINTMLHIYYEQGKLPVWHLASNETNCMVGNPGVVAVADALVKGYCGFNRDSAMVAMRNSIMMDERWMDLRKEYGYVPSDLHSQSLGHNMEYDIADAAYANAAGYMGNTVDSIFFAARSHSSMVYWDPETRFFRGKRADGSITGPFDPCMTNHLKNEYTECNEWQYLWLVPHNLDGLVEKLGGREATVEKLDSLFSVESPVTGGAVDVTGIIGQYAHGNEPGHHTAYFYSMLGENGKAADMIRRICSEMYTARPDGLCGNEDEGQMSAWYLLSAMGFYQVEPACPRYWFGTPLLEKAVLKVSGGKFTITAEGLSDDNRYIGSITLNGKPYDKPYIAYEDIVKGGSLVYHMAPESGI
ncbi:MAG: GH92 family glycosyl hydrolase [Bacteroidales bacterium]|nr:GH92 family glycosyl hydrolase [Bacteroidales bacterium]